MDVTTFHHDVARAELDFAMQYLRDFRAATGTRAYAVEPVSAARTETLEHAVRGLAEWLDAFDAGSATRAGWQEAVNASIENGFAVRWFLYDLDHRHDPAWQFAERYAK